MAHETVSAPTQMPASERFAVANDLMKDLGERLQRHGDYRRVVTRATLSVIPGEVESLGKNPIPFRNRGNLHTFQHTVEPDYRRMVLEIYEDSGGKPLEWMDRVVLSTDSFNRQKDGHIHYHREVQKGEDPEPLNDSPSAVAEVRRVIASL